MKWLFLLSLASGRQVHQQLTKANLDLKACHGIDILELTIPKAHEAFLSGALTPHQLAECYINRINAMNPYLGAVLRVNPAALTLEGISARVDPSVLSDKPLFGIPVLVKGNIAVQNINNTAGSVALGDNSSNDAEVVKKLRKAGAVILGTANLSEPAGLRTMGEPDGWSEQGGQTKNP